MKRLIALILLLMLAILPARAEILPDLTLVTPTPSPAPTATEFACEAFIINLPANLTLLDASALEGYEAAVRDLHPSSGQIQLAAMNAEGNAALCLILLESLQTPLEAAQEAALQIAGSAELATEAVFGANSGAGFSWTNGDTAYSFHFFSNGSALLMACSTGLEAAALDSMLTSLDF